MIVETKTKLARDIVGEVLKMVQANHKEAGFPFDLKVNEDLYRNSEYVKIFHMDDEDDNMVGYAVYMVNYHQHHMDHIMAFCDVVYVDPEYRGDGVVEFLKSAEAVLTEVFGIHAILYGMPIGKYEGLMEAIGMKPWRTEYMKITE